MIDQTETSLSKETLLQILDNLPTSIFVKDDQLRFVFCNKQNQNYIGCGPAELYGRGDADFYTGTDLEKFMAADRQVIDLGESVRVEEMAAAKDGMSKPVMTRKSRLQTSDGKTYLIGTNSDLTEIKKREEQYRALAETVPVGVVQIEEDGQLSFANPLLLAYFRKDISELKIEDIITAVGQSADKFPGQASRFECTLPAVNGQERRVLVISSGWLALSRNRKRSAMVSFVDISENVELKRVNEEILRLNKELALNMQRLKDAQDALVKKGRMEQMGQLTATIAHELRNPLGAVRTSVFLLERKLANKGLGIEPQLQRINNGVSRCDNIITQLLDFSRNRKLECLPADLDAWLAVLIEEEAKRLPSVISLECVLGLNGTAVPFDASRLQRAVVNLLSNAAEAMVGNGDKTLQEGGPEPRITISTKRTDDMVEISVRDNGPGIALELIEKIREPLFTTKSFGTGLGVPAIEQIASQHGGRLTIESHPGEGAVFTLQLPITNQKEKAA
jgi:PAS domain S-box-containing protein